MGIRERSEDRDGYKVRVLAVHTTEGNDNPRVDDAAALRDATWWVGSSHAIADNDPGSLLTPAEGCVPYDRAAWTLRSGNRWSENIELVAFAGWTRAQWLARPKLLENCARWLADRSKARGIPLVKLTPQQYRAGQSGVIGHHDHTIGYSDGTHWDPGPNFPYDVVLSRARDYADGIDFNPAPEEDDDMPLIVKVTGGPGTWLLDSIGYHSIKEGATVQQLEQAGVKAIRISSIEHDRWVKDQDEIRGILHIEHLDQVVGDHAARVKDSLAAPPTA